MSSLKQVQTNPIDRLTYKLPLELTHSVEAMLKDWQTGNKIKRLWSRDSSLWTGKDEGQWLDWLDITDEQLAHLDEMKNLAQDIKQAGFSHALLLGMGGSSLCPEVMAITFGNTGSMPELHVLDSTDPAQVLTREKQIDLAKTIFIVSSKSGSTLEPNIFAQYFWQRAKETLGTDKVGDRFIAITDPNSHLHKVAQENNYRHIYFGRPGIGGRYSALSRFGMVPSSIMGVDLAKFLEYTKEMVTATAAGVPVNDNPGAVLGIIIGVLAKAGRDKVTLVASPAIADLGAWLEQLLAESTGKQGHGIIPIDREQLGTPDVYGTDRLFIYLRLESAAAAEQDKAVAMLENAGQPVVRISIPEIYYLGQEFFRWEIATAVAGSIIGINAFDQPDVEASKIATRELTTQYEKTGSLPPESPIYEQDGIKLFTDTKNAAELNSVLGKDKSLSGYLNAHLSRLTEQDYFALLAYIEMNEPHQQVLQTIRHAIRDKKGVATCLGFGPRFLHSTGQAYKGGPNTGVFLQITCDDAHDLPVPGQKYTFGVVKAAQARGDFQVLAERNRRALRIHLQADLQSGLSKLHKLILEVLR